MHNNQKMNRKDLQELVRQAIQEVINEDTIDVSNPASLTPQQKQQQIQQARSKTKNPKLGTADDPVEFVEEAELEEDNQPVKFELAPDVNAEDFTGKKARIISTMQNIGDAVSKPQVAKEMGYTMVNNKGKVVGKQNPINADFMALVNDGIIVLAGTQTAPRFSRPAAEPAGEEVPAGEEGPEGGVAGEMSDEEIEASFAKAMGSGDEEPEAGEIETSDVSAASMSDEDYEAFMQYTDLEGRLAKVKSDILKTKRSRRDIGDIADEPSSEIENLRALKDRLQKKMNDLLAKSDYLKKRQAKLTGKPVEEPKVDAEEETMDEWMKGRMQYYAGIKK